MIRDLHHIHGILKGTLCEHLAVLPLTLDAVQVQTGHSVKAYEWASSLVGGLHGLAEACMCLFFC